MSGLAGWLKCLMVALNFSSLLLNFDRVCQSALSMLQTSSTAKSELNCMFSVACIFELFCLVAQYYVSHEQVSMLE
jgi:hypothetical protein